MINNMDEAKEIAHCGVCGNEADRCTCTSNAGLGAWSGPRSFDKAERRINPAFHKGLPQKVENQKSDAQVKLEMLKTVRDMHERDIMALMRIRSSESIQAANRLVHMGFYDALEAMEAQLKAELAEA